MRNVLEVSDLETGYMGTQILWKVSFGLSEGEIVAIIGPNGAGKTTLTKAIMGFIKPWKGVVKAFNKDVTHLPPHKKVELGINLVPEGRKIFPEMSVIENLFMGAYMEKNSNKVMEKIEKIYNIFPILKERIHQKARTLSGGEQQMLAIARALMTEPRILILDEPTLGLSPKVSGMVIKTIEKLREDLGVSILLIEEKIKLVLSIADRIYIMNQGKIIYETSKANYFKDEDIFKKFVGL
ncbi:MAG: ABC transporter ATP-binding protein [Desulfurococcales archaeon]|jgi:branched-chain amino acid transport system ATP-binding protein|nr:ABC transporter ATP-binding protein [Desulfurococcales archaeon]